MNKTYSFSLLFVMLFLSCHTERKQNQTVMDTINQVSKIKNVCYSLPSSIEMITLLKNNITKVNTDSLHSTNDVEYYNTTKAQAVNFGIYSADLAYCIMFKENFTIIKYIEAINKLSNNLRINNVLNKKLIEKIDKNINNFDSLEIMISDVFYSTDEFLKENNQNTINSYIIVGSWIECSYFFYLYYNSIEKKSYKEILLSQKYILESIRKITLGYLDKEMTTDLDELQIFFDDAFQNSTNNYGSDTDNIEKIEIRPESIKKINEKISIIRKKYITLH